MSSVFIGGSRRLSRMSAELAVRLDNITGKNFHVLIGDANGFDRLVQTYLAERGYAEVLVYCTAGVCRNNVGDWPTEAVTYNGTSRGFEFYSAKDDAMIRDSDFGLFGWDGKSKGTLRNIREMAERGKPTVVYIPKSQKFVTIRGVADIASLGDDTASDENSTGDLFLDVI